MPLDLGIRDFLTGYKVTTVGEATGRAPPANSLSNAQGNYVLLTLDRGFEFQHNLKN